MNKNMEEKKKENLRKILEKNRKLINGIGVEKYASILKQLFIDWGSWKNKSFTDETIEDIKNCKNYKVTYDDKGISYITVELKGIRTSKGGTETWFVSSSVMNIVFFKYKTLRAEDSGELMTEIPIATLYLLKDLNIDYDF